MTSITAKDVDRPITVAAGEEISLTLDENRTTGFQWTVESVEGEVTLVSCEFESPAGGRAGTAGRRAILLRAQGPGSAELRLRYRRPWETGSETARQSTFRFVVKPA